MLGCPCQPHRLGYRTGKVIRRGSQDDDMHGVRNVLKDSRGFSNVPDVSPGIALAVYPGTDIDGRSSIRRIQRHREARPGDSPQLGNTGRKMMFPQLRTSPPIGIVKVNHSYPLITRLITCIVLTSPLVFVQIRHAFTIWLRQVQAGGLL
jgi:hypothetical protein